jgi:nucleotide-binding universal stress UspA family protein
MTRAVVRIPIRRILVALDATSSSEAALESVARLAVRAESELLGLFVEDIDLLNLAGLPFARESCLSFSLSRRLVTEDMERALRAQAERARALLEKTASRQSLRWSFRVVRGRMAEELQSASEQADLIAFGLPSRMRAVTGAPAAARTVSRPILFLPRGATLQPPFGVVFDGRDTSHRALALAAQLAGEEKRGVTVLVAPGDDAKAPELEEQAANLLRENHVPVEYRRQLDTSSAAGLLDALDAAHLGALVLPADLDWLTRDALDDLLDAAECAVLLVR